MGITLAAFRRGSCPNPEGAECDGICPEPHLCALDRAMNHLDTDAITITRPGYLVERSD